MLIKKLDFLPNHLIARIMLIKDLLIKELLYITQSAKKTALGEIRAMQVYTM